MKLFKKEGNLLQIISFPMESAEKGDYLLVEDQDAAKALIAQVIDVQFALFQECLKSFCEPCLMEANLCRAKTLTPWKSLLT